MDWLLDHFGRALVAGLMAFILGLVAWGLLAAATSMCTWREAIAYAAATGFGTGLGVAISSLW